MFRQFASQEISEPSTHKGTEHLDRAAAKQKSKSTARKSRGKTKCDRRIQTVDPFDMVKQRMKFLP